MSMAYLSPVSLIDAHQLASVIRNRIENVLIIDSRSFIEHNTCHIASSVNVCCSKIVKRRLQQDKLSVKELLMHTCQIEVDEKLDIVTYDQSSKDADNLPNDSFTVVLLKKLQNTFHSVNLLTGGFDEFQKYYPDLCEDKTRKCPPLSSLSQPCLPIANQGPTRILPFLYLGSQFDAMNKELLKDHNITYELNVSASCPQPEFVPEGHFLRIPVNDTYNEKLLPYFPEAFNFLDKVREGSGCVLVHCLAGISRSPTIAIAYVMRYLHLSSDDGYRYVKSKRPTISPNFNFLGQLLEYEKQLRRENVLEGNQEVFSAPPVYSKKRVCRTDMRTCKLSLDIDPNKNDVPNVFLQPRSGDQSPTTALAKLSFDVQKTPSNTEEDNSSFLPDFRQFRSKSCYGDWLRDRDETIAERKSKECNIAVQSKVLSPVKEIKCDALISEISTGASENTFSSIRQRMRSSYCAGDGRQLKSFSHFSIESHGAASSNTEERFSLETLTHHRSFSSNIKVFCKSKEQPETGQSLKFLDSKVPNERIISSEYGKKRTSVDKLRESSLKKEKTEINFPAPKSSLLHPFSFNIDTYKRSETSDFGSESSDCPSEASKKTEQFRFDIDLEELEDDVISRNQCLTSISVLKSGASDQSSFPFPDVSMSQNLRSPLSPSESHLLEDLDMEKDTGKTEPSSPCTSFPFEDSGSFHDSGFPISPSWSWMKKRVEDRKKYDPLLDLVGHQAKVERLWLQEKVPQASPDLSASYKRPYQFCDSGDNMGLYRVQSCPGILSHISSFCTLVDQSKKHCTQKYFHKDSFLHSNAQEIISHESCPDVLHCIEKSEEIQSNRHREFRRNVRFIQVS